MSTEKATTTQSEEQTVRCPQCDHDVATDRIWRVYRVCPNCNYHARIGAIERVEMLLDRDSFDEINHNLVSVDPLEFTDSRPYRERVMAAREKTGLNEAVLSGRGKIRGHEIVIAIVDFGFLGGSMGSVAGEKIALAFEHAIEREVPIVTLVASGGARMQEGMLSLVQMAKTTAAAQRAHDAGIPYVSIVTDPTTGGMYASYVSQGDVILAEPEALIGFAGPRVISGTMPDGDEDRAIKSHTAEYLLEHGFLDSIVDRIRMRDTLSVLLRVFSRAGRPVQEGKLPIVNDREGDDVPRVWDTVQVARQPDRPTALDYIRRLTPQFVELHGDRAYGDDPAVVTGLGEIGGRGVVIIGLERGHDDPERRGGQALPEGYRKALRMMRLARRLNCPIVTFVDTPGAFLGIESEERGLASALSQCIAEMSAVPVPVISIIIGEGGSGGALALGVADRVLMQEHSIYSVIAPEGAAAILYRDASRAPDVAEALKITAADCVRLGVADALVAEPEAGAHTDPDFAAGLVRDAMLWALYDVQDMDGEKLVAERYKKFRRMGQVNRYWREMLGREAGAISTRVARTVGSIRDRLSGDEREPESTTKPAQEPAI